MKLGENEVAYIVDTEQLKTLRLKYGSNEARFSFTTKYQVR